MDRETERSTQQALQAQVMKKCIYDKKLNNKDKGSFKSGKWTNNIIAKTDYKDVSSKRGKGLGTNQAKNKEFIKTKV